ncbi:hypothetical protein MTO96_028299 [Rhipicephalus appendiculatus]
MRHFSMRVHCDRVGEAVAALNDGPQKDRGITSGSPARTEEADQAGTTAAWARGFGATSPTQDRRTQRDHVDTTTMAGGAAFLLQRRTVEDSKGATRPAPGPCPVAVSRLHGGGGRRGSAGCPATDTGRCDLLRHVRRGRSTTRATTLAVCTWRGQGRLRTGKPPRRWLRGLRPQSDADLPALCRRRMGEDPHFAALLSGPPAPPPPTNNGAHEDGEETMDVERLLEL